MLLSPQTRLARHADLCTNAGQVVRLSCGPDDEEACSRNACLSMSKLCVQHCGNTNLVFGDC